MAGAPPSIPCADGSERETHGRPGERDHPAGRRAHAVVSESGGRRCCGAGGICSERREQGTGIHGRRTPPPANTGSPGTTNSSIPEGYPAIAPPWGTLNAINLNTGEYAWKIPLGEYPALVAKGMKDTGSENYGGPIVTAGGLVFIAATNFDRKFRAFDKQTGKLLWETTLPFAGNATPITYSGAGSSMW